MSEQATETHHERSAKASRPCVASDMTFGGRCLNCGFGEQETRPTPTPWAIEPVSGSGSVGSVAVKVIGEAGSHQGLICDVSSWWYSTKTAKANARLIVRAVNSFDALANALRHLCAVYESFIGCDPFFVSKARAALALAEKVSK